MMAEAPKRAENIAVTLAKTGADWYSAVSTALAFHGHVHGNLRDLLGRSDERAFVQEYQVGELSLLDRAKLVATAYEAGRGRSESTRSPFPLDYLIAIKNASAP